MKTRGDHGTALAEGLVVLVPFLVIVFSAFQLAMLNASKLTLDRAANAAGRAAMVILDDASIRYDGEPRLHAPEGSRRHEAISDAARKILLAVEPPTPVSNVDASAAELWTPSPALVRKVRVRFPGNADGVFTPDDTVEVSVELDAPCRVPIGRRLLCRHGHRTMSSSARVRLHTADYP